jgi:hypothetical protein
MTRVTVSLQNDSTLNLLIALLKRLSASEEITFAVEQNGQAIALSPAREDDARFEAIVNQIIADAMAGKFAPLTKEELKGNAEYWERKGAELNLSDDDIVHFVKEHRAEHRAHTVA